MKRARVVVVGAGAAGLTAALRAAESGAAVTLLNAHAEPGLKILMSGGTRCNVTHREVSERDFNTGSRAFVRRVLAAFDVSRTVEWMRSLGVGLVLEPTGKYFPATDDAHTVRDALATAVARAGVAIETGARVVRLEAAAGGADAAGAAGPPGVRPRFRLGIQSARDSAALGSGAVSAIGVAEWPLPAVEPERWLEADAVILATGGLSFPRTGSDGTGFALAAALGHAIEPPTPALTPLTADDPLCRLLQGVTVEAELRLSAAGEEIARIRGPLLFTHFGYSGPAALDLSRHWLHAAARGERLVRASFLPGVGADQLDADLVRMGVAEPRLGVRRALARMLPERLAEELCREAGAGADAASALSQLPRALRARLVERVLARPLPINGTLGYEKAEVTAGGVRLPEVNPSTLESRRALGLYFCGEMLDVDGRLGGFNFQWAWSSGTVAGRAAALPASPESARRR